MTRGRRSMILVLTTLALASLPEAARAVPPGAPLQLTVTGGSGWRPHNGFELTWQNPTQPATEVWTAEYRVFDLADGALVGSGRRSSRGVNKLDSVVVPGPGQFWIEVRLEDISGSQGPSAAAIARFDDVRPGNVIPQAPRGWLAANEFPYVLPISPVWSAGPSSVAGYALTLSDLESIRPCPSGICGAGQITLPAGPDDPALIINGLAEGDHWVSAVGVSGAGLASLTPGVTRLRVDRTPPVSTISGVPEGWVRQPVTVEVMATDSASGMELRPGLDDGNPVTVIQAGREPARVVQGASASLRVAGEGLTRVRYWARDLAGNVNDGGLTAAGVFNPSPGEAIVKIDRRAPVVSIDGRLDPADPELLRAIVRDTGSGLDSGRFSFRRIGSAEEFTRLDTTAGDGLLTARLPSDALERGRYEIRAEADDRAGNHGLSTDVAEPVVVSVPLKAPTELSIRFADGPGGAGSRRIKRGAATRIRGRVRGSDGTAFAGAPVLIEQSFAPGSRHRRSSTTVTTDRAGGFTAALRPGPTRTVRAGFAGTRTAQPAFSRNLKLISRDRVRFHANPALLLNGGTAVMSGMVSGKGALQPDGGKLVAIQYFDPSRKRWRPVEVIRADRRGRFRYRYRFRTIAYAQKILFRAVSLPEAGWPFETTASRRRAVIVYPSR